MRRLIDMESFMNNTVSLDRLLTWLNGTLVGFFCVCFFFFLLYPVTARLPSDPKMLNIARLNLENILACGPKKRV